MKLNSEVNGNLKMLELSRPDYIECQSKINEIVKRFTARDHSVAITIKNCSDIYFQEFQLYQGHHECRNNNR